MNYVVGASLLIAGIIHLLPLSGVLGSAQLAALYGMRFDEPNIAILMRHRAVLFGLIGGFMLLAAFRPALRTSALVGGAVSVASFLVLAMTAERYNAQLHRVVLIDAALLVCLLVGAIAHAMRGSRRRDV